MAAAPAGGPTGSSPKTEHAQAPYEQTPLHLLQEGKLCKQPVNLSH